MKHTLQRCCSVAASPVCVAICSFRSDNVLNSLISIGSSVELPSWKNFTFGTKCHSENTEFCHCYLQLQYKRQTRPFGSIDVHSIPCQQSAVIYYSSFLKRQRGIHVGIKSSKGMNCSSSEFQFSETESFFRNVCCMVREISTRIKNYLRFAN